MFVAAWSKSPLVVAYRDENGDETLRSGGSRSWRNFNPGNIIKGSFAEACGAIGGDSRFAIFPDEETGLEAIATLLTGRAYRNRTLRDAIHRYAPPSDGNKSEVYVAAVSKATGIAPSTILRDLGEDQIAALTKAIQTHEGWKAGTVTPASARNVASVHTLVQPVATTSAAERGDGAHLQDLIAIGADRTRCDAVRRKAFDAMIPIYGTSTPHNACACTLVMFLREAGIDIAMERGAGRLARILEKDRHWQRVKIGRQQAGDVAVTLDLTKPFGADHIFLVVDVLDADRMLIADNQGTHAPHERFASGKGKTPVDYFLRAPGAVPAHSLMAEASTAWDGSEIVDEDEDTHDLVVRYRDDGTPLAA